MKLKLDVGCTLDTHRRYGIHVVVNARSGEMWRNDQDNREEIERIRDADKMRALKSHRVAVHQWNSRWFCRRFAHLLSERNV